MPHPSHDCPKCGRALEASGEVRVDDERGIRVLPIYQCPECLQSVMFDGEPFDQALSFAVDGDRLLDAESLDPLDLHD